MKFHREHSLRPAGVPRRAARQLKVEISRAQVSRAQRLYTIVLGVVQIQEAVVFACF